MTSRTTTSLLAPPVQPQDSNRVSLSPGVHGRWRAGTRVVGALTLAAALGAGLLVGPVPTAASGSAATKSTTTRAAPASEATTSAARASATFHTWRGGVASGCRARIQDHFQVEAALTNNATTERKLLLRYRYQGCWSKVASSGWVAPGTTREVTHYFRYPQDEIGKVRMRSRIIGPDSGSTKKITRPRSLPKCRS